MKVSINGELVSLPDHVKTIAQLAAWRNIPSTGTAIAIDARIIKAENWAVTKLEEQMQLMIISAAYGG